MSLPFLFIAGSAGATQVIHQIIGQLSSDCPWAVVVVCHCSKDSEQLLIDGLNLSGHLPVVSIEDKMSALPAHVYVAPGDYHVLLESQQTFALSVDAKVHFCRPSIDVCFTSAARALGAHCTAILLSGSNQDGAQGLSDIKHHGGQTLVQSPESCQATQMTQAAINIDAANFIGEPTALIEKLAELSERLKPKAL